MSDIKYQDIYTYLSSSRNMKQFIKRCDYGLLIDLQNKLDIHISEWAAQQEKEQEAIQLRNEKRSELLALIVSEGFSLEELITAAAIKTRSRRRMKYQYRDGDSIKKWSGVGRVPRSIQERLNSGATLDDFLIAEKIKNENQNKTPHN
ncbi:H-NS histone family protein [Yersinia enterocolitica]|nr:H-NS histone family protein [Yersinia enterocolitica]